MAEPDLIQKAIQALKDGERERAQALLTQALAVDPKDDRAWVWLAACVSDQEKKLYCLNRALAIRPDNAQARQELEQLTGGAAQPAAVEIQEPEEALPPPPPVEPQPPDETEIVSPPDVGESPTSEAGVAPVAPPADESPEEVSAPKASPPPSPPRRSGFSRSQTCLVVMLAILMIAALIALVVIVLQNPVLTLPSFSPPPVQAPAMNAPVSFIQLPSTWTPTVGSSSSQLDPTLALTPTGGRFPTPLPSLTPISSIRQLVIGRSVQNRPIEVYRFGSGPNERMIVAGIHGGDEGNTISLAEQLIAYLRRNPRTVPAGYTLYILRALNPDGEVLGNVPEARLNANGVDLNRNFDIGWKSTWRSAGCSSLPGTAGSGPSSEPETQALKDFLRSRQVQVLISYHSAYLGVFPSGEPAHPESIRLAQAIHDIGNYPYPPVRNGCEYTGTLVDWAASNGVIAAVDLELNSGVDTEFDTNLKVLSLLLSFEPQAPPSPLLVTPSDTPQGPTEMPSASVTLTPTLTSTLPVSPTMTLTATP